MRKEKILFVLLMLFAVAFQSCDNTESYAEKKKKENNYIQKFIDTKGIKVISFEDFCAQDSTTNVSKNEFVLFKETGVYMQIVRQGDKTSGKRLDSGDKTDVLARYTEYYVQYPDSIMSSNVFGSYSTVPDRFTVVNSNGTYTASFDTKQSLMYTYYQSASVPAGWLLPLSYIYLTRWVSDDAVAKINLIVPHSQGQPDASNNVYPCYYELTYEIGK